VAICFFHSYANPAHERAMGDLVRKHLPGSYVALSSRVRKNSFSDPLSRARQAHEYIDVALVIQIGWPVEASTEFFRTLLGACPSNAV
jgi:hypothetical protein